MLKLSDGKHGGVTGGCKYMGHAYHDKVPVCRRTMQ